MPRKGFGDLESAVRQYIHYLSIPLYTQLIRTIRALFEAHIVASDKGRRTQIKVGYMGLQIMYEE